MSPSILPWWYPRVTMPTRLAWMLAAFLAVGPMLWTPAAIAAALGTGWCVPVIRWLLGLTLAVAIITQWLSR